MRDELITALIVHSALESESCSSFSYPIFYLCPKVITDKTRLILEEYELRSNKKQIRSMPIHGEQWT